MTIGRLKWFAIVVPTLFLTGVWVVLHGVAIELHHFPGVLVVFATTVLAVALFAFGVFAIVNRLERRIVLQNQELERRTQELEAVLAVGRAAGSSLELDELLDASMDAILEVTRADAAEVWVGSDDGGLVLARHRGLKAHVFSERARLARGEGLPGLVAEADAPVVVRDVATDSRVARARLREAGFHTYIGVPMTHREEIVGVLGVCSTDPARLSTENELRLVRGIGERLALAIVNARLHEQVLDGAVLEERVRIARELHDGLAQVLGYINTQTLAVKRNLGVGRVEEARAQLDAMEDAARDVYGDVREAILDLRVSLPRRGLVASLRRYIEDFESMTRVSTHLDVATEADELELPPEVEIQAMRIVQEALSNVRKHAAAARVTVTLAIDGGSLVIGVVDDGRGFDPDDAPRTGWPRFGLQTMRERAAAVGGRFAVLSTPGGTRVEVTLPRRERTEVAHAARAR